MLGLALRDENEQSTNNKTWHRDRTTNDHVSSQHVTKTQTNGLYVKVESDNIVRRPSATEAVHLQRGSSNTNFQTSTM